MSRPLLLAAPISALLFFVHFAQAEPKTSTPAAADNITLPMKPGLWQNTVEFSGQVYQQMVEQMLAMKQQLDALPAEQRKLMEQMMASQGISLRGNTLVMNNGQTEISDQNLVHKECITQKQIDERSWAAHGEDCTFTLTAISENHFKTVQTCEDRDDIEMQGDLKFQSPESFVGTGTASKKAGQTMNYEVRGKWLSECGGAEAESAKAL